MPELRRGRRRASLTLAALLALGGCAPAAPTAAPTPTAGPTPAGSTSVPASGPPTADVYAQIRVQVEAIRGLKPTAAVDPVVIDEATLRKNLEAEFDAENTAAELAIAQDILITLGLLKPGSSLRTITLEFQAAQVAGYYSPDKDQLFVVNRSGSLGPADRVTYAHEFTHQLQDQHFNLNALSTDATDEDDRSLARLALIEGDAVSVQTTWTQVTLTPKEIGELLASSLDPKALQALQNAPAFLRDTALFPYQDGVAFVTRLIATGGYAAVDAAFAEPPASAEQVLHPDKYLQHEGPKPVAVPPGLAGMVGSGWSEAGRDTLGELVLRIWLRESGVPAAEARVATAGWGGDRLVLLRGPGGAVTVAFRTEWDSGADADEFGAAVVKALGTREPGSSFQHPVGSKVVSIAIGDGATILARALAEGPGG